MQSVQSNNINYKLPIVAAGLLFCIIALPSVLLLAKMAIGLAVILLGTIAVKIVSKVISGILQEDNTSQTTQNQADSNTSQNLTTRGHVINIAIGLMSVFVAGISLLAIAKAGLIAACIAVVAVALYECTKARPGKDVNEKLDKTAEGIHKFIVDSVESCITRIANKRV